jgi:hypothetical protein
MSQWKKVNGWQAVRMMFLLPELVVACSKMIVRHAFLGCIAVKHIRGTTWRPWTTMKVGECGLNFSHSR